MNMKIILFCSCVFLSLIFTDGVFALIDDFNDGNDSGWNRIQGEWSIDNGEYVQSETEWTTTTTNETYTRSFFGNENWTDYTLEAKVRMEGGGETAAIVGIFFRVTEKTPEGDYYYFRLDARAADGPALIKSPNTILQENVNKPSELEQDYILKVEVEGDNIKCYIDGELEIELQDDSFPSGAVGVGTFNTQGYFDDVSVNGEGIAPNPVSSEGKLAATWALIKQDR
ncbi:DUF1080 domain-containing protein [Candidatus Poribacteria bacterium]|nr:DUF1080 domain-containing protein [Candidatus Poribacteria bacterium]